MSLPHLATRRFLFLVLMGLFGCSGPFVEARERGVFHRQDYGVVGLIPFEAQGEVSPAQAERIRGWVELELLTRKFRIVSWTEVHEKVRESPGEPTREAIFQACRESGASGLWNARARAVVDREGVRELTLVLRLHDLETGDWILELRGHDHVDPPAEASAVRETWIGLIREIVSLIPEKD